MTSIIVLAIWFASGVAIAGCCPQHGQARLAWAPVAFVLGPLWFLVAREIKDADAVSGFMEVESA